MPIARRVRSPRDPQMIPLDSVGGDDSVPSVAGAKDVAPRGDRDEPSRSVEIERVYDVDAATPLPQWSRLPGVDRVDGPEPRELDARYFDTDDAALARSHIALRRRTGGPDEGWHVKMSRPDGRHEWQWPLEVGESAETVPAAIADAIAEWAIPPFRPIARIRNARVAYALRDAEGGLVAEVVDDHVRAVAERTGGEQSWREWEVELGPAAPADVDAFFRAVDALVFAVGARPAASDSKLARTLAR